MFKKLLQNKKAQQTAEYALLIALVVAAVIAMQTYAQRTLQARIKGASGFLATSTSALGNDLQYEPYYLKSQYDVTRDDTTTDIHDNAQIKKTQDSTRTRALGGFQESSFNIADNANW